MLLYDTHLLHKSTFKSPSDFVFLFVNLYLCNMVKYLNHQKYTIFFILQLICSVDPKFLHLTPHDQVIYTVFRQEFPSFNVKIVNEDELKNQNGKVRWRIFCEGFKDMVEDYNYGTLLRVDCNEDYTQENSILVPRIQFLAIELARNREGYNDLLRKKFKPEKKQDDAK